MEGYKAGKGARKKGPNGSRTWHRGKGADEWPSGKRDDGGKKGGKKGSKGSKPDWHSDKDKGSKENARARKAREKPDIAESKNTSEFIVHSSGPTV